jgi:hypothetical protein
VQGGAGGNDDGNAGGGISDGNADGGKMAAATDPYLLTTGMQLRPSSMDPPETT